MRRNLDRAREAMQRWRARHPERRDRKRADDRAHYRRHRIRIIAQTLAYRRANPEVGRRAFHRRRARLASADGSFTVAEWQALVAEWAGRCAYRGEIGPLTIDHRIPLVRGGTNWISNILPACHRCNSEKGRLTEEEFRERLRCERGGEPFGPPAG